MTDFTKPPPKNWRDITGHPKGTRRIEIDEEKTADGWNLVDRWRGECLSFSNINEAKAQRAFANRYIKKHGDINFQSFPYSLDDELVLPDQDDK